MKRQSKSSKEAEFKRLIDLCRDLVENPVKEYRDYVVRLSRAIDEVSTTISGRGGINSLSIKKGSDLFLLLLAYIACLCTRSGL